MKIKAVIFDLDGTLINSIIDIAESMNEVLFKNGYPTRSVKDYQEFIGNGIDVLVAKALPSKINSNNSEHFVSQMREIYSKRWDQKTYIYEGVAETLSTLKSRQVKLAVLSNKPHKYTIQIVEKMFEQGLFDIVFGKRDGYLPKPDPKSALEIADCFGLKGNEILYVGDSATDMQTAISAKMIPIGVSWGYKNVAEIRKAGSHHIIELPTELLKLV